VLRWLGFAAELFGQVPARELAARCRGRLWDEERNHDPPLEPHCDMNIDAKSEARR
jgi:hypothetical protein